MREDSPPPPLDATSGTPEELRAVLRALGREGPGRGTLERVARDLGPLLDAAPGLSVPVAQAARTGGKLLAARALAALLALGSTAYLVQRTWLQQPSHVQQAVPATPVEAAPQAAPEVIAPAVLPSVESATVVPEPPRRHRSRRKRAVAALPPAAVSPPLSSADVADTEPVVQATPAEVARPALAAEQPPAEEPPARKVEPPPPDEFGLLWQARVKIRRDPAGALALLDAHAGRFANGQLAPEREVLAVEALRALGRTDEAEARLRGFRAKYPGSIHLRRLQKGE
jgi:hypothetical protein